MVRQELKEFVTELSAYLERPKAPAEVTIDLWLQHCGKIPSECLPDLRKMIVDIEAWPKNFPKSLWGLYYAWLDQHPEKRYVEAVGCPQCHEGFITVSRYDEAAQFPDWQDLVFRCGACNSSKDSDNRGIPAKTQFELLKLGYFAPAYKIRHAYHKPFPLPCSVLDWNHPVRLLVRECFKRADAAALPGQVQAQEIRRIVGQDA